MYFQLATALDYLSTIGIIHADLKPENIMLTGQGMKVKLIDFGLSHHVSQVRIGMGLQTLWYRCPEIMLGLPFTGLIDMWSLGCVVAELLIGFPIYPGDTEYDMWRYIRKTLGELPDALLDHGIRTHLCFTKGSVWRLKVNVTELKQRLFFQSPWDYLGGKGFLLRRTSRFRFSSLEEVLQVGNVPGQPIPPSFIDLMKRMLQLDSNQRITPRALLEHPFISSLERGVHHNSSCQPSGDHHSSCCPEPSGDHHISCCPEPSGDHLTSCCPEPSGDHLTSCCPEPSGDHLTSCCPEPSGDHHNSCCPEPSGDHHNSCCPEPSGDHHTSCCPEPSGDHHTSCCPEPSGDHHTSCCPEPSVDHHNSCCPEPSGDHQSSCCPEPSVDHQNSCCPEPSGDHHTSCCPEPSGDHHTSCCPEPSGDHYTSCCPEPSVDHQNSCCPEPSGDHHTSCCPEPSGDHHTSCCPEPSVDHQNSCCPEPSGDHHTSCCPEPSGDHHTSCCPEPSGDHHNSCCPEPSGDHYTSCCPEPCEVAIETVEVHRDIADIILELAQKTKKKQSRVKRFFKAAQDRRLREVVQEQRLAALQEERLASLEERYLHNTTVLVEVPGLS
ncbi:Homeodomain-interacting protein kinase 2 [Merluccius polli]|uniref:Homeodomain-interacting protein kinase 2 n=1 Tax=Merluccius polli TaxID=89951 RepID=A0AA47M588_MERPO|nr:Homeodomain-interacting protein kinase 2 [Merluccius polli]